MQSAIDQIRQLRALHEDGLLSAPEFERRKDALLDAAHAPQPTAAEPGAAGGTELGLMEGQQLGPPNRRYRLERLIASGATGQVWQATDLATQAELGHSAQVALKVLWPELTASRGHAKLLVQEATRARRLAHEHIVRVYDWACDPATSSYFVIMEYLDGEDLERLLAREGRLPLGRVLTLLAPVGAALDHAWDRHGLVHRDIKPANVFVTARGEVKLLDFGIAARARAGSGPAPQGREAPPRSGTPGYRAPEAGAPECRPARSLDVYAVAAMVHRMLSGQLPDGAGAFARPDGLGDAGWAALQDGLARDPARRPHSVGRLLAALAEPDAKKEPDQAPDTALERQGVADPLPAPASSLHSLSSLPEAPEAPEDGDATEPAEPAESPEDARARVAAALVRAAAVRLRREQEKRDRLAGEAARRARRAQLREQLAARRDEEAARARLAQDEAQRKAHQARAAAAYLAEQERASAEPAEPGLPGPQVRLLRDRFQGEGGEGPQLVLLAAGRFQMGSPEHERAIAAAAGTRANWLARETPQRWVGIEASFAMGRYPVTVGEWRAFVQATGWRPGGAVDWAAPGFFQTDLHPVVGVSWLDAQHYLAWLSERCGARYRLPSEAEWEYACRAGTRTAFSCGDAIDTGLANYDGNFSWNGGARGAFRRGTTLVTQFPANPWGLHDMHGNVWEWVQDRMHDDYAGAPNDGRAWEAGGDPVRRVLRGGCWLYHPRYLRSALRNAFAATLSNEIVGFRVVRELAQEAPGDALD